MHVPPHRALRSGTPVDRFTRALIGLAILAAVAALGPAVPAAAGLTYYVSPVGDDSHPGTLASPWRTIQHAANAAGPGDTVVIRGGLYNEHVVLPRSGTAAARITFQRYPGETPILDGTGVPLESANAGGALFQIGNTAYITLDGLEIRNSAQFGITGTTGSHHVVVENCLVHDVGASGISFGGNPSPSYNIVRNNTIYNTHWGGVVLWDAHGGYFLIEGNTIHDWQGIDNYDGIEVHGVPYVIIRNNVIYNGGAEDGADYIDSGSQTGTTIEPYTHHIIYDGNTVYCGTCQHTNSVKLNKEPRRAILRRNTLHQIGFTFYAKPFHEVAIYHNTVVSARNTALLLWQLGETSVWGGITFKNNIFAFSDGYLMQHSPDPADGSYANIRMDHNLYRFSSRGLIWATSPAGEVVYRAELSGAAGQAAFDQWRGATGQEPSGGTRTEAALNQLFVNVAARDVRLGAGSPAVDAGGPLTWTGSAGSGTTVPVLESFYFTDGLGMIEGDVIQVGAETVRVTSVNETADILTVDRAIAWASHTPVSLPYAGAAPDQGAYELGSAVRPAAPRNLRILR